MHFLTPPHAPDGIETRCLNKRKRIARVQTVGSFGQSTVGSVLVVGGQNGKLPVHRGELVPIEATFAPHECSSFSQVSPIFMHITTGQTASSVSTSMRRIC